MRQTHHWAADVFVASIIVHLARVMFTGRLPQAARLQLLHRRLYRARRAAARGRGAVGATAGGHRQRRDGDRDGDRRKHHALGDPRGPRRGHRRARPRRGGRPGAARVDPRLRRRRTGRRWWATGPCAGLTDGGRGQRRVRARRQPGCGGPSGSADPATLHRSLCRRRCRVPAIGRRLLGEAGFAALQQTLKPGQQAILVAASGAYSFKGSGYVRGGIFDRIELVQGDSSDPLPRPQRTAGSAASRPRARRTSARSICSSCRKAARLDPPRRGGCSFWCSGHSARATRRS